MKTTETGTAVKTEEDLVLRVRRMWKHAELVQNPPPDKRIVLEPIEFYTQVVIDFIKFSGTNHSLINLEFPDYREVLTHYNILKSYLALPSSRAPSNP